MNNPTPLTTTRPFRPRRRPGTLHLALWAAVGLGVIASGCGMQPRADQASVVVEKVDDGASHKGEEGKMGKPTSKNKTGLYAMKGPRDAIPQMEKAEAAAAASADEARRPMGSKKKSKRGRRAPSPMAAPPPVLGDTAIARPEPAPDDATGEGYAKVAENDFLAVNDEPLSTFSIKAAGAA